jgi:predicted RNA-binding protein (virulence factor B family)
MTSQSAQLGKINHLVIVRDSDHGFYLDGGELGEILLPNREIPADVEQGDEVEVFVSRDSEDRIVATSSRPTCEVGDFVVLEVKAIHPKIGAFLDWGYSKDLLLPFREQLGKVRT